MDYRFTDLVDIDAFQGMLKSFYEATGILHGLVDSDNNVISAIGWQDACTKFHRACPVSNERCLKSNRYLAEHAGTGPFVGCLCENGLMDYAAPIVIEGRQLATLYFGQVLHEPPDMEFFRRQAQECGFDEEAYLAAIRKVPVVARERVEPIMAFFSQMAQMLARSGLDRLHQREAERGLADLNRDLSRRVDERTAELAAKNSQLSTDIAIRQQTEAALRDSRSQLQAILDSSPIGIGWSCDGEIEYVNKKFTEMFGYRLEDIPTVEQWYRFAYPDEAFRRDVIGRWAAAVAAARDGGVAAPVLEAPVVCKNGSIRYVMVSVSWSGERRLVNFSDISDRWRAEQRNRARGAILQMIAEGASLEAALNALADGVEAEDRGMLCSILLLDAEGKHLHTVAAPSLPPYYSQAIDGVEIGDGVGSCGTAAFTRRRVVVADIASHPYWVGFRNVAARAGLAACWSEPILSSKGRLLGTFAIYHSLPCTPDEHDIRLIGQAANLASIAIEHHHAQDELEQRAQTDFLTGLANRRHFIERAGTELARAVRYGKPLSILMLDLDHFKAINDKHGHEAGDMVLQSVAATMARTLREIDIVARIGGEEFVALLPETGEEGAPDVADRLRQAIAAAEIPIDDGTVLRTTVSIGVAGMAGDSSDVEDILRRADAALYAAKHGGRNRVCIAGQE